MRHLAAFVIIGTVIAGAAIRSGPALHAQQQGAPDWAYGLLHPLSPDDDIPECTDERPVSCARPRPEATLDKTPHTLPGAPRPLSALIWNWSGPGDWYPGDAANLVALGAYLASRGTP